MKSLQEIENTSFEELEKIALEGSVKAPADLDTSVRNAVAAATLAETSSRPARRPLWRPYALLGAFAAACIGVILAIPRNPKDTYDDPLLAYAKVEETFALISSKLDRGVESVRQAEEPLETIDRIINNNR
jgi:hypothetical protein